MTQFLEQYISSIVLFVLGAVTVIGFVVLNRLLAPKKKMTGKIEGLNTFVAYECGEIPIGVAQTRFNFQYYVFALVFVIFDVVTSFMVAWALVIKDLAKTTTLPLISLTTFLGILAIGFIYWWKRNALSWM